MKKFICLAVLFIASAGFAQERRLLNQNVHACGWNKAPDVNEIYEWETDPDDMARQYIQRICEEAGIEPNFIIRRANVPSALSTLDEDNKRVIYYSLSFFQSTENKWFKMSVLAHEIGHFMNYHNLSKSPKRPSDELVADVFAGTILARLGGTLEDVKGLMNVHCSTQGDDTYPPKTARIEALEIGFEKGKKPIKGEIGTKEKDKILTDEEIIQKIVGTWKGILSCGGNSCEGTISYDSNGNFTGITVVNNQIYYNYSGSWRVTDKENVLTITNSSNQLYLPIGTRVSSKILTITNNTCDYIDYTGIQRTAYRLN